MIVVIALVTTIVTAVGSYKMIPQYAATATLWVPASKGGGIGSGDILLNDRLINTYAELTTSRPVLAELERRLNVPAAEVKNSVSVSSIAQTELLQITVQDANSQRAADIATNLANIVIAQTQRTDAGRSLRVSLFAPAGVPSDPTWLGLLSTPYWREINIVLGFVISLAAGMGLAFLFEYLDMTLYTTEQIEAATELSTLGQIPIVKKQHMLPLLSGNSFHSEAFRYLRTSIFSDQNVSPQTLLVTSAIPREGKSTIVANLASAIAQSERRVIVVDANLRLPTLHEIFNLSTKVGLSSLLRQEVTLAEALQDSGIPGVQVITSGPLSPNAARLLDSPHMLAQIEQLKQQADVVLIDAPAVLAVTDAAVLAPLVDGVLLVVGRTQVQQEAVRAARWQLASINATLVGVVVNWANQDFNYGYRYTPKRSVHRRTKTHLKE